ncbi:MAG: MBL fold metallo-hydrolase [Phycisphaerales bacterium]|nr:MBL fold metallo-hydrolase [Phycisphaerales bacterium]
MPSHSMDIRILSIGTLAAHPLWEERHPVRTGHSTTTLIQAGDAKIIVDPGLPATMLNARLGERAGITPDQITHVFLTSFHPECRRGIELFDKAQWLISEKERESVGIPIAQSLASLAQAKSIAQQSGEDFEEDQEAMFAILQQDVAVLSRCQPASDLIIDEVDLFPLPGFSIGMCGLLLCEPTRTTLVCGDALPTVEHLDQGKVLPTCADRKLAQESFKEAIEIADVLILGRDNMVMNPTKRGI